MRWDDLRNKLFSKEEQARTDVLIRLNRDGIISGEQADRIIELEVEHPEVELLLDALAKKYELI